jgi:hypothetical protein
VLVSHIPLSGMSIDGDDDGAAGCGGPSPSCVRMSCTLPSVLVTTTTGISDEDGDKRGSGTLLVVLLTSTACSDSVALPLDWAETSSD